MSHSPHLIYLHGFLSSPQSEKAQQTVAYFREHGMGECIHVPTLNCGPRDAIDLAVSLAEGFSPAPAMFMGSSLGGFYATCLAVRLKAPAVLLNPAVRPHEYWQSYVGRHKSYHSDEVYEVTQDHIAELEQLESELAPLPADNIRAYLQTGDETLDYRRAVDYYGAEHCVVHPGGSHSYDNYVDELPAMLEFLQSRCAHE